MSVLLQRPGAVEGTGVDAGVASHYGAPHREQVLLSEGRAVVDLSHRGVVTLTGPDRLTWLHSLTTQHLAALPAGVSAETLVLSPKGHIEHALHVVDDGARTWMTTEPGQAEAVAGWLDSMRFMLRVDVADVSEAWAVLGETGPGDESPATDGPPAWVDPWPGVVGESFAYGPTGAEHPGSAWTWREVIVPRAQLEAAVGERELAGTWAAEALRVAAWRPRAGVDTDHRTIPHELDWLRTAVHLQKGCYRGQETVARVKNLGRPPRRMVFLHLDGSGHVLPEPGTELVLAEGGRAVGRLTSVVRHHEDGPVALGVVKYTTDPAAVLLAGDVAAAPTPVVAPDLDRVARPAL